MAAQLSDHAWVAAFEKPKTDPAAFEKPATTVLSPYLKFGCLSARVFHAQLSEVSICCRRSLLPAGAVQRAYTDSNGGMQILRKQKKHSLPPVSLIGQLLWCAAQARRHHLTSVSDAKHGAPFPRHMGLLRAHYCQVLMLLPTCSCI